MRNELLFLARLALKPLILTYAITDVLYVFLEQAVAAWLPTFNAEILHLPASISIELASEFSLSLAVGGLLGGAVLRRFRWFAVLSVCLAGVAAVVLAALPLAQHVAPGAAMHNLTNLPPAAFLFPAVGLFLGPINPAINSAVLSSLPREHQSAMAGLIVVFSSIGGTTGALITGSLFQATGVDAFYFLLVPVILLGIALAVFRNAVQRMAATENRT
jgi:MFS transporter, FHS family, glucose/mannose:H+ symporter